MLIETARSGWRKSLLTNSVSSGFTDFPPTLAKPVTPSSNNYLVLPLGYLESAGGFTVNHVLIKPFGVGSGANFSIRVWGFDLCPLASPPTPPQTVSYEFQLLCELAVTLGAKTGTAGFAITGTDYEASAIAVTTGNANVSLQTLASAAAARGAYAEVDAKGLGGILIDFSMTGTTPATSGNVLTRRY